MPVRSSCWTSSGIKREITSHLHRTRDQLFPPSKVDPLLVLVDNRLLGVRATGDDKKQTKVQKLAKHEVLMVNIGSTSTGGKVLNVKAVRSLHVESDGLGSCKNCIDTTCLY